MSHVARKMASKRRTASRSTVAKIAAHKIWPYLILERKIDRNNQVFALDTTYISMACGLVYLTAVIDPSRKTVGKRNSSDAT